jgi:putative transposase
MRSRMAIVRRRPEKRAEGARTILHSDHGSQFTSWAFGQRLEKAGLLASMGTVGDCYDNAMVESFWGTLQLELLDSRVWQTREELANAIFEWIECWYNPDRRHSSIGMHSPISFETLHTGPDQDRLPHTGGVQRSGGTSGKLHELLGSFVADLAHLLDGCAW